MLVDFPSLDERVCFKQVRIPCCCAARRNRLWPRRLRRRFIGSHESQKGEFGHDLNMDGVKVGKGVGLLEQCLV